jgi:hypothetical protein
MVRLFDVVGIGSEADSLETSTYPGMGATAGQ